VRRRRKGGPAGQIGAEEASFGGEEKIMNL